MQTAQVSGADLKRQRVTAGIGIRTLAADMGRHPATVQQIEGSRRPRSQTVEDYFRALAMSRQRATVRDLLASRLRVLVEELARVLIDAATEQSHEKPTTPVRPSTTGVAVGARSAPDETGYTS